MVAPGDGVAVRADLVATGPVALTLVGIDGGRREVGSIEETDQGHFDVLVRIPVDLAPGPWTILAEVAGAPIGSAVVQVGGDPVGAEDGGQGGRDEDDPLLVPLPSGWQASRTSAPATTTGSVPFRPRRESVDLVPIVSLGAALGALVLLVVRTRRPRRSGGAEPPR